MKFNSSCSDTFVQLIRTVRTILAGGHLGKHLCEISFEFDF